LLVRPRPRRINSTAFCGNRSFFANGLEGGAAWFQATSCSLGRCSGTGTTTPAASAFLEAFTSSVRRKLLFLFLIKEEV
jgi:hypothetical protein